MAPLSNDVKGRQVMRIYTDQKGVDGTSHGEGLWSFDAPLPHGQWIRGTDRPPPRMMFFDMDATLVEEETLVSMARLLGKEQRVAEITAQAMRGEIDFPESVRRRLIEVAGLSRSQLRTLPLHLRPGARELMAWASEHQVPTYIVSGGFSFHAEHLARELKMTGVCANVLEFSGEHMTGQLLGAMIDGNAKASFVRQCCQVHKIDTKDCLAFGDGSNDRAMMQTVGWRIGIQPKPALLPDLDGVCEDFRLIVKVLLHLC